MPRLVIALVAFGLLALGGGGDASAQVWKVKKAKPGVTAKATPKTRAATRVARPSVKKKTRTARSSRAKVQLVPDETEDDPSAEPGDRHDGNSHDDDDSEPAIVVVKEVFD